MFDKVNKSIKIAGLLNVVFWSLITSAFVLADTKYVTADYESGLLFLYLFFSMLIGNIFLYGLFYSLLSFWRLGGIVSYLLANGILSVVFLTNYLFVLIFGKQLGMEGLVMMIRGWEGGELGNFTSVVLNIILAIAFYLLVFFLFFRIMDRTLRGVSVNWKYPFAFVILLLISIPFLHLQLIDISENSWKMEKLKYKIPWQSVTGFPADRIRITNEVSEDEKFPKLFIDPPMLSEDVELENVLSLKKNYNKVMNLNLSVKKPMNILFINVEGLRYDMLNSENAPNFFRFANERGVQLKHHYTTGNNTPGSLIGMFTGLSPFHFEPHRENSVPTMPLEILKKVGYRQSIYYNSPKYYEYIYRDFLEKTEGNFIKIPGRIEDYAIREKKLIDQYIKELEEDNTGKPRFDYYLVNVTHFNYYYPKEFEKYKPAFTMEFEIISGRQKKFKKHKQALMNRYKNSILYFDHLFGQLISDLDRLNRLDNTIIAIAGDHGEEFWEHGSFGHTWGLNNKQIQTAASIYFPKIKPSDIKYKYTSHQDFFPTVFDIIGLNLDSEYFSTGKSLVDYKEEKDYAISSLGVLVSFKRNDYAIIGNGYKILFKNNKDLNSSGYAIYDDEDRPVEKIDSFKVADLLKKILDSKRLKPWDELELTKSLKAIENR